MGEYSIEELNSSSMQIILHAGNARELYNEALDQAEAGMESAVPIIGLLQNTNSADDFIAEATNTPVSGWSQVKAAAGVGTTSALSAAVAAAGVGVVSGAKSGGLSGILTGLKNAFTGKGATGKVAIAAGIVAAGASILTYIGSKLTNKD